MSSKPVKAHDAASVLVLRDGPAGPQIYMVRRPPASRFMANALVFVGGRLDEADMSSEILACGGGLDGDEAARRLGMEIDQHARASGLHVTAIRECFEESGLLLAERVGLDDPLSSAELAESRRRLLEGRISFAELCRQHRLRLLLGELHFLDHWITPEFEPRRFDARFFACQAPDGQIASFDPRETTLGGWFTVEEALRENRQNRQLLAPPTLTILERLLSFRSVAEVLASTSRAAVGITQPRFLPGAEPLVLLLPGDHRYDNLSSSSGPEHYVTLEDGHWSRICRG